MIFVYLIKIKPKKMIEKVKEIRKDLAQKYLIIDENNNQFNLISQNDEIYKEYEIELAKKTNVFRDLQSEINYHIERILNKISNHKKNHNKFEFSCLHKVQKLFNDEVKKPFLKTKKVFDGFIVYAKAKIQFSKEIWSLLDPLKTIYGKIKTYLKSEEGKKTHEIFHTRINDLEERFKEFIKFIQKDEFLKLSAEKIKENFYEANLIIQEFLIIISRGKTYYFLAENLLPKYIEKIIKFESKFKSNLSSKYQSLYNTNSLNLFYEKLVSLRQNIVASSLISNEKNVKNDLINIIRILQKWFNNLEQEVAANLILIDSEEEIKTLQNDVRKMDLYLRSMIMENENLSDKKTQEYKEKINSIEGLKIGKKSHEELTHFERLDSVKKTIEFYESIFKKQTELINNIRQEKNVQKQGKIIIETLEKIYLSKLAMIQELELTLSEKQEQSISKIQHYRSEIFKNIKEKNIDTSNENFRICELLYKKIILEFTMLIEGRKIVEETIEKISPLISSHKQLENLYEVLISCLENNNILGAIKQIQNYISSELN